MSDNETNGENEKKFWVDKAKTGRAGCKKCKQKIDINTVRIAKMGYNPFGGGMMKQWHHIDCILEVFKKQRPTTAKIEKVDDMGGWDDLTSDDQEEVLSCFPESLRESHECQGKNDQVVGNAKKDIKDVKKEKKDNKHTKKDKQNVEIDKKNNRDIESLKKEGTDIDYSNKDNSFREFRKLCSVISDIPAYTGKTEAVKIFFDKGTGKNKFQGDLILWIKLLLPGVNKRIYNLQSKQIVKLFSRIFNTNQDDMLESLEQGDVAETICIFFEQSQKVKPAKKGKLSLKAVDDFLEELSKMTREDDQAYHFEQICPQCTSNDLKMIIRLIKHDLRINSGPKHILNAIHPDAYQAFQTSRDLESVVQKLGLNKDDKDTNADLGEEEEDTGKTNIALKLMTPVLPMLAQTCKSVEQAMKKCPNGMYSEIKYDGERVQVHKKGNDFKYFSRSLKPVLDHKVKHFKDYLPKAFPHGKDLVLDSEILLIDKSTNSPLPFGSLGKHKKDEFHNACVCLFIFDCIHFNGESLLNQPIQERKKILLENMTEIEHHVVLSEMQEIHHPEDLEQMMSKVFIQGLEGLVLKDIESTYKPGKRHWLKVKKDYLFGGSLADSADLVVLGAWYGTGNKGGMMSVFLMGCYDLSSKKWCTVTKVHGGHDDATLKRLQSELDMVKISKDATKLPQWLNAKKTMIPDFVAKDPKAQPVWEISGAEFTQAEIHTADGISIRFPRVTKIRDDKDWKTATNLDELKYLFKKSKETSDFQLKPAGSKRAAVSPAEDESLASSPKKAKKELKDNESDTDQVKDNFKESKEDTSASQTKTSGSKVSARSPAKDNSPPPKVTKKEKRDTSKSEKNEDKTIPELPDVFKGVKIYIPSEVRAEFPEAEKYVIAFGGTLLPRRDRDEATHVLGKKVEGKECVKYRWFYDSVRSEQRQDEDKYRLK